ncbi:MAG TPA: mechanosensitive ion channel domain-containing protein [Methanomicrobiales archaeon]|nr:mechanosensitive ion channel domain-containing protein [Methanomicrobiales archaeon]
MAGSLKRLTLVFLVLMVLAAGTLLFYGSFIREPTNLPGFLDISIKIAIIGAFWLANLFLLRRVMPTIKENVGEQAATTIETILVVIAGIVLIFALLSTLGISPENLLVGAGIASITMGVIVSSFMSNVLSGILVVAAHKLRPGDEVIVCDTDGTITEITAMVTRVRTEKGDIALSNSGIASGLVVVTKIHSHEMAAHGKLPYSEGDRIVINYVEGEGTVTEITPFHTTLLLDSGEELAFLNSSVLTGEVAVARITRRKPVLQK